MYRCWFTWFCIFLSAILTGGRFTRGKTYPKEEFTSLADEAEWEETGEAGLSRRFLWPDFWFTQVSTWIIVEKNPIANSLLFKIIFLHFFYCLLCELYLDIFIIFQCISSLEFKIVYRMKDKFIQFFHCIITINYW